MKYVGLALGLLLLAFLIFAATGKSLSIDEELAKLTPADRQALDALLAESGLTANKLRAVAMPALKYARKGIVVQNERVVGLHLSEVSLPRLGAVVALTGLQELWLSDNGLTAVPGLAALTALQRLDLSRNQLRQMSGLSGLPALQRARLSNNAIQSLADLHDLPMLTELDLANNQLTDLSPLTTLPMLTAVDVTGNPLKSLPNPTPAGWKVKSDLEPAPPPPRKPPPDYPPNWVEQTPPRSGEAKDSSVGYHDHKMVITIQTMRGSFVYRGIPGRSDFGGDTTLELEVRKGRVRAYLSYFPPSDKLIKTRDGYIFAEAEPGKPAKLRGYLEASGGDLENGLEYSLVFESLDGTAEGITCRMYR
jgi:Leucine-rich repeat (LRR) protein